MLHSLAMLLVVGIGGVVDLALGRVKQEPELAAVPLLYVLLGAAFLWRSEAGARNGHESVAVSCVGGYPMMTLIRRILAFFKRPKQLNENLDRAVEAHEKAVRAVMEEQPKSWGHTAR